MAAILYTTYNLYRGQGSTLLHNKYVRVYGELYFICKRPYFSSKKLKKQAEKEGKEQQMRGYSFILFFPYSLLLLLANEVSSYLYFGFTKLYIREKGRVFVLCTALREKRT